MLKQKILKSKKPYLIPIVGYILIIIIGSILLALPCCNYGNVTIKDLIFSATCGLTTTGFTKVPIITQYTFLGQLVLAILMEIGGLGFIIFISYFLSIKQKKLKMSDMILINDNISSDNYASIKEHSKFIFRLMVRVQVIGAIFLALKFIPYLGFGKGIWYSIFHSISAFSNTGYDLFTGNSLYNFRHDIYLQIVLMILMTVGSIGVFIIEDLKNNKFKSFKKLKLQTKIVLIYSIFLTIVPAILIIMYEPEVSFVNGLFMTVSARAAGFSVVDFGSFSSENKIILMILMFIGGAPASASGGIKILVLAIIIATMFATLKGKNETIIFWRKIPDAIIKRAFTIFMLFIVWIILASFLFFHYNPMNLFEIVFEVIGAISNGGLSIINFDNVNIIGEMILIVSMFVGRVGPLSLLLIFVNENKNNKFIEYPSENVIL